MTLSAGSRLGTFEIIDPRLPANANGFDLPPVPFAIPQFAPNSWSPDGKWIAGQNGFTTLGILLYSVGSRTYERILDVGEWPVWLPDSRQLIYVMRGREYHLFDTRTGIDRLIYSSVRDTLGPPRFTRDGRVAFFSRRVTESDVWIARLSD